MSTVRNDYGLEDGLEALIAEYVKLAITDYLAGPQGSTEAAHNFYTARTSLIECHLMDRVHRYYGEPAATVQRDIFELMVA